MSNPIPSDTKRNKRKRSGIDEFLLGFLWIQAIQRSEFNLTKKYWGLTTNMGTSSRIKDESSPIAINFQNIEKQIFDSVRFLFVFNKNKIEALIKLKLQVHAIHFYWTWVYQMKFFRFLRIVEDTWICRFKVSFYIFWIPIYMDVRSISHAHLKFRSAIYFFYEFMKPTKQNIVKPNVRIYNSRCTPQKW